nr:MAG TPA: hypothetical protein [Caudoviricetes sp.]
MRIWWRLIFSVSTTWITATSTALVGARRA